MIQHDLEPPGTLALSAALAEYISNLNTWISDRVSGAESDEFDAQKLAELAPGEIRSLVSTELAGQRGCTSDVTIPARYSAGIAARWLSSTQLEVRPAAVFFYGSDGLLAKPLHPSHIKPGGTLHVLVLAQINASSVMAQVKQRIEDLETTTFDKDGYSLSQAS